jgi:hypothetical protein
LPAGAGGDHQKPFDRTVATQFAGSHISHADGRFLRRRPVAVYT